MDLLLYVEGRRVNDKVGPVLRIFAAPDKLGIEIAVPALVRNTNRTQVFIVHDRLVLGCRYVQPLRLAMPEGLYRLL